MDETTPRPLPPQLLGAYRDPIALRELLVAKDVDQYEVYTSEDHVAVRDEFARLLEATYGTVWVSVGRGERTASAKARSFRTNARRGIDYLIAVPEYADRRDWHRLLAQAMQPRWSAWWNAFDNARNVGFVGQHVLGGRQLRWLAAQYARTALVYIDPTRVDGAQEVIAAAERFALSSDPSTFEWRAGWDLYRSLDSQQDDARTNIALLLSAPPTSGLLRAACRCVSLALLSDHAEAAIRSSAAAASTIAYAEERGAFGDWPRRRDMGLARISDLTRELFRNAPPSLV